MIDTITLLIPYGKFQIQDYDAFTPSAKGFFEPPFYIANNGSFKSIQNMSAFDKSNGIYKPKLTITKQPRAGSVSVALKIEFSVPKLMYGNNFDEVCDVDFSKVVTKLYNILKTMAVDIDYTTLKSASVVGIHYGKNFVFTNHTSISLIIATLAKLDVSKRLGAGNTDYLNNGQTIRYHANSYELVFYDKLEELKQSFISKKRSLEKDALLQKELVSKLISNRGVTILRMELRFNGKRKLRKSIDKLGFVSVPLEFQSLFSQKIAQSLLCSFWCSMVNKSLNIVLLAESNPSVVLHKLSQLGIKQSKALTILGALQVIHEHGQGVRGLKKAIAESSHTYRRIVKELEDVDVSSNYLHQVFQEIEAKLSSFKTIKIKQHIKN